MTNKVQSWAIGGAACVALVGGLVAFLIMAPTAMTPEQLREHGLFVYEQPKALTDFTLHDHQGQPFTKENLQGRWTMMFFGFTSCPDVCPTTMASISRFHQQLSEVDAAAAATLQVVLVSVDPKRDTNEKLDAYVHYFGKDYVGATGEFGELFTFTRQLNISFGYVPGKSELEYDVTHSGEIVLINPQGEFQGFFKTPADPQKMLVTFQAVLASGQ